MKVCFTRTVTDFEDFNITFDTFLLIACYSLKNAEPKVALL